MFHENDVLLSKSSVRISANSLASIGIRDGSSCWGLWIPLKKQIETEENKAAHFVVSPFPPNSWPNLFRIVLKLEEKSNSLLDAIGIISKELKMNVHTTACAPSGHHHATCNMVAEPNDLVDSLEKVRRMTSNWLKAHIKPKDEAMQWITSEFSIPRFLKAEEIETILYKCRTEKFLHKKFTAQDTMLYSRDIIVANVQKKKMLRKIQAKMLAAVSVQWLENLATFWLYNSAKDTELNSSQEPWIHLYYDSNRELLIPTAKTLRIFRDRMESHLGKVARFPLRTTAFVDHHEQYVRITSTNSAVSGRNIFCDVRYESKENAAGFLHRVLGGLGHKDNNIEFISNATTHFVDKSETGKISFVLTDDKIDGVAANIGDYKSLISQNIKEAANSDIAISDCRIVEPIEIGIVGAHKIFISNRFKGLKKKRPKLFESIRDKCRMYGLLPVDADIEDINPSSIEANFRNATQDLTGAISSRLSKCDCFLQIIAPVNEEKSVSDWINFELGCAIGAELPTAICVDTKVSTEGLTSGWGKFPVDFDLDREEVIDGIEKAISWLSGVVRSRATHVR